MMKRSKYDPFRLCWKILKLPYQDKNILMSELERSRASAHER